MGLSGRRGSYHPWNLSFRGSCNACSHGIAFIRSLLNEFQVIRFVTIRPVSLYQGSRSRAETFFEEGHHLIAVADRVASGYRFVKPLELSLLQLVP